MTNFGQWDAGITCFVNQIPQVTERRNHLVAAYNAAREKIVETQDVDLANRFNNLKMEIDQFHYKQQLAYPCPWADPSPWGRQYREYANRFNSLRREATNLLVKQKKQQIQQQNQIDNQNQPETPQPEAPQIPKAKASPPVAKACAPRPCGTPPYNMSCQVPGRGPVPPVCKCGQWICPGGPSAEKIAEMRAQGKGGISPYMSQAYNVNRYAAPKASGLGGFSLNRSNLMMLMATVGVSAYLYFNR